MKLISTIIILLVISPFNSSTAQSNRNTTTSNKNKSDHFEMERIKFSPVDSVRMPKPAGAKSFKAKNNEIKTVQLENKKVTHRSAVKQIEVTDVSRLEAISNAYWETQTKIKKAKSQNDFVLKESHEQNSLNQRKEYVSVFESFDREEISAEQTKLYQLFKKDFNHE